MARRVRFGLCLLAAWGLVVLVLGELTCRAFGIGGVILYRRGLYEASPDPELGYGLTPGHRGTSYGTPVQINEFGFRSPPFAKERSPGTYRVICVGDSFTFGMGVRQEESWPAQLEARLSPPPGYHRIEVVNAGVPGYNLRQYGRQIELALLEYEPNLILMGLVENDLEPSFYVEDGYLCVPRKKTTISFPGKRWLQTHSHLYQAVNMRYQGWMAAWLQHRNPDEARSILFGDRDPAAWEEAVDRLSRSRREALRHGVDIYAAMFGLTAQSPLPQIVERAQVSAMHMDLDGPDLRLQDGHPNARGHAHFAEQIALFVQPALATTPHGADAPGPE